MMPDKIFLKQIAAPLRKTVFPYSNQEIISDII